MYAFSTDEERYHGRYDTESEAVEGAMGEGYVEFWVGECVSPTPPEDLWYADDWIDHVACQDDYCHEFAEGWDSGFKKHVEELEQGVRAAIAAWLDRHGLRPGFFLVEDVKKYKVVDGEARRVKRT